MLKKKNHFTIIKINAENTMLENFEITTENQSNPSTPIPTTHNPNTVNPNLPPLSQEKTTEKSNSNELHPDLTDILNEIGVYNEEEEDENKIVFKENPVHTTPPNQIQLNIPSTTPQSHISNTAEKFQNFTSSISHPLDFESEKNSNTTHSHVKNKTPNFKNQLSLNTPLKIQEIKKFKDLDNDDNNQLIDDINQEMNNLYNKTVLMQQIAPVVKLKIVDTLPMNQREADCYYYVKTKEMHQNASLSYIQPKEFVKNTKDTISMNVDNTISLHFKLEQDKKFLEKLQDRDVLDEDTHYLNLQEINEIITDNVDSNPRPIITPEIQSAFATAYKEIANDLLNKPDNKGGNLQLAKTLNTLNDGLLENDTNKIISNLQALLDADIQFGDHNVKPHLKSRSRISRAIATLISTVVGAIVGFGTAALITAFTCGFGAPAGVLGGIGAGAATFTLIMGLFGFGLATRRDNKINKFNVEQELKYNKPATQEVRKAIKNVFDEVKQVSTEIENATQELTMTL